MKIKIYKQNYVVQSKAIINKLKDYKQNQMKNRTKYKEY